MSIINNQPKSVIAIWLDGMFYKTTRQFYTASLVRAIYQDMFPDKNVKAQIVGLSI